MERYREDQREREEGEAARDRLARRTHVRGESNRISRLNRGGRGSLRKYVIEPVNKDTRNRWQAAHFRVRAHAHRGKRKRSAVVVAHRPRFKSRQIYRSVRRRAEATKGMTSRSYARVSAMCVGKEAACWRNEERERERHNGGPEGGKEDTRRGKAPANVPKTIVTNLVPPPAILGRDSTTDPLPVDDFVVCVCPFLGETVVVSARGSN